MKIISFDVGIKNLAYCIINTSPVIGCEICVNKWGVINLLEINTPSDNTTVSNNVCNCLVKAKKKNVSDKPCGKKAKYFKGDTFLCETHAKSQTQWLRPSKEFESVYWKKKSVGDVENEWKRLFVNMFSMCQKEKKKKADMITDIVEHYQKHSLAKVEEVKKVSAKEVDLVTVGRSIEKAIRNLGEDLDTLTHVVIENQISPIASRMKTIQGMLAQTFIMLRGDTISVEFVSSSNKLKGFERSQPTPQPTVATVGIAGVKKVYKSNKVDGMKVCRSFLEANTETLGKWTQVLDTSVKKDDLADCFLQGIWYLKTNKIIMYADNLKIKRVTVS